MVTEDEKYVVLHDSHFPLSQNAAGPVQPFTYRLWGLIRTLKVSVAIDHRSIISVRLIVGVIGIN